MLAGRYDPTLVRLLILRLHMDVRCTGYVQVARSQDDAHKSQLGFPTRDIEG